MLRQLMALGALRRMGPLGKVMIAAQLGSMAYGMYKQSRARKMTRAENGRNGVGLGSDDGFGPRAGRGPLNPFG